MVRKSPVSVALVILLLVLIIPASILPLSRAAPSYSPGVSVGNSVTYGQISYSQSGSGPVPSGLGTIVDSKSIVDTVTSVDPVSKNVGASQTYNFKNGTSLTTHLFGNVADGSGNLSIFILAGGLRAGDRTYNSTSHSSTSFITFLPETVTKEYAGAIRSVNVYSISNGFGFASGVNSLAFAWDQTSGFLLEVAENATTTFSSSTTQTFAIDIKATSTNIWNPSITPDFSLDATFSTIPYAHRGESFNVALNLTSYNNFANTIGLGPNLLNSSITNPPTLSLKQSSVSLTSGMSATDTLTFSTGALTPLGLYMFSVNATVGTAPHGAALFAMYLLPADFEVSANPASLTVAPGNTVQSTISVKALGIFTGQITLASQGSNLLQASLNRTTVTLSSTMTSVNATLSVSASPYHLPGVESIYVSGESLASQGSLFSPHTTNLSVNVTGPDFEISSNSSSLAILPGGTHSATVTLTSFEGFSGNVALAASTNYNSDLGVSFSPAVVTLPSGGSVQAQVTVSVPTNTSLTFQLVDVIGISGLVSRNVLIEIAIGGPSFSISANPQSFLYLPGGTANSTITLSSLNGFKGSISVVGQSFGAAIGFVLNTTTPTLSAGGSAALRLTLSMPTKPSQGNEFGFLEITASNGNISQTADIFVSPQPSVTPPPTKGPDFALSSNPSSLTIVRSQSETTTVALSSISGFSGTVSLNTQVTNQTTLSCLSPTCITASLNRTIATLASGSTVNSLLTIQAPSVATAGIYTVYVTASNATTTRSAFVDVTVIAPDFQVFPNTGSLTIFKGASASPTIIATSEDNFQGTVSFNATITTNLFSACPGASCPGLSLSSPSAPLAKNGTATTTLTIATSSNTPVGSYRIIMTGNVSGVIRRSDLSLNVVGAMFELTVSPLPMIITPGGSGSVTATLSSLNGFSGVVTVTPSGTFGMSIPTTPFTVNVPTGGWASHTFTVSNTNQVPGRYDFDVSATSGTISTSTFEQVVAAGPSFALYVNGSQYGSISSIQAGKSLTIPLTIPSLMGFSGTVSLSYSSLSGAVFPVCPGTSCPTISFGPTSFALMSGGWENANLTVTFPTSATPGFYNFIVNATSGKMFQTVSVYVEVTAPPSMLLSVVVGTNGRLYSSLLGTSLSGWTDIGGMTDSEPGVCASSPTSVELVVRGTDDFVYHKSFSTGVWSSNWDGPGGKTVDQPACAVLNGVLYVAVRGSDNNIYVSNETLANPGVWSQWMGLGGGTVSAPVLVATPSFNRLDLIVRGTNNGIYHKFFDGFAWSTDWDSPGGGTADVPAVVSDSSTFSLDVVIRGVDNATYYSNYSFFTNSWSGWTPLGGKITTPPTLAIDGSATLHLVVRGVDNNVYHKEMSNGVWSTEWAGLGGGVKGSPAVAVEGSVVTLVVTGLDGSLYYNTLTGSPVGWIGMNGGSGMSPSVALA